MKRVLPLDFVVTYIPICSSHYAFILSVSMVCHLNLSAAAVLEARCVFQVKKLSFFTLNNYLAFLRER